MILGKHTLDETRANWGSEVYMKHDDETKLAVCVEVKDNYCVVICRECGKLTKMYAINGVFDGKNAYCNKHQLKIIK